MLKRILTILFIALLPNLARAEGLYAGMQATIPAFGVHLGWDGQDFGVRGSFVVMPFGSLGYGASVDAYWITAEDRARFYLGGGGTVFYEGSGRTTYTALEGLVGFRVNAGNGTWTYIEWNPGFTVLRYPPLTDTFEYFPIVEIFLIFRLNIGLSFKF
jgi:hypothetical protein